MSLSCPTNLNALDKALLELTEALNDLATTARQSRACRDIWFDVALGTKMQRAIATSSAIGNAIRSGDTESNLAIAYANMPTLLDALDNYAIEGRIALNSLAAGAVAYTPAMRTAYAGLSAVIDGVTRLVDRMRPLLGEGMPARCVGMVNGAKVYRVLRKPDTMTPDCQHENAHAYVQSGDEYGLSGPVAAYYCRKCSGKWVLA